MCVRSQTRWPDGHLLALSGVGAKNNKALGFASCLGAAEVSEKRDAVPRGLMASLTSNTRSWHNTAFTRWARRGGSANTSVLYIGLKKVREALLSCREVLSGMLVNLSKPVADGTRHDAEHRRSRSRAGWKSQRVIFRRSFCTR